MTLDKYAYDLVPGDLITRGLGRPIQRVRDIEHSPTSRLVAVYVGKTAIYVNKYIPLDAIPAPNGAAAWVIPDRRRSPG